MKGGSKSRPGATHLCHCKSEDAIGHNGPGCEASKDWAALDSQDSADKGNLEEGRDHIENERGEHEIDTPSASVDHTRQGASLTGDMEG